MNTGYVRFRVLHGGGAHRVGPAVVFQLRLALTPTHEANVAQIPAHIDFQHLDFQSIVRNGRLVPVKPDLPAVGHRVGQFNVHDACAFPVAAPPRCRMETPEVLGPPLLKMIGNRTFDLLHQSGSGNSHKAAGPHEMGEVVQIQVVGPEVRERINAHDGVEEVPGEWQRPGIRMDRIHAVQGARVPDALDILRGADPKVGCPDLHAKFTMQKDRRRRPATAEVQHPHGGSQVQRHREPLG